MHTVISAFDDRGQAERAVEALVERGFDRERIHLEGNDSYREMRTDEDAVDDDQGFWHRVANFFRELFGEHHESTSGEYAEAIRRGGSVVLVDAADEAEGERARAVLNELGGSIDMDERVERWRGEGWTGHATDAGASPAMGAARADEATAGAGQSRDKTVMPVVQEKLQVGKREVKRGGVRVIQRVTETPVKEMVRLREERAVVERRPADRPAGEADFANLRDGTIEVRETIEEPVVSKTARVVEEVVVGKRVGERTETVSDTVRRTDVHVEPLKGDAGEGVDEAGVRTRIRGAREDAAEATGNALERAGAKVSEKAHELKDDLTGGPDRTTR